MHMAKKNEQPASNTADIDAYLGKVIMAILHIMRNMRHSGMEFTNEVELSYPQILVLYSLLENEPSTISGISNHLKISQGVVSRLVDRLVDKEMVERERDSEDRRVVRVTLSGKGREFATYMISLYSQTLREQFEQVSEKDRDKFLALLKQIDSGLEDQPPGAAER